MNTMNYKGYAARIEYSDEDDCFVGHIAGINDVVGFHGDSVSELHAAYRPHCMEMCRRIVAKNDELKDLLAKSSTVTPEIESKLAEAAQLRLECQKAMLKHCMAVSQTMPPEQGKRYLAWVEEQTFMTDHGMGMSGARP